MSLQNEIELNELNEIEINGQIFCTEEVLMVYAELEPDAQARVDHVAEAYGAAKAIETIYRDYFPNYF